MLGMWEGDAVIQGCGTGSFAVENRVPQSVGKVHRPGSRGRVRSLVVASEWSAFLPLLKAGAWQIEAAPSGAGDLQSWVVPSGMIASNNSAPVKSAPSKQAPRKLAAVRSAFVRSAPERSA